MRRILKGLLAVGLAMAMGGSLIYAGAGIHWAWTVRGLERAMAATAAPTVVAVYEPSQLSVLPAPAARYLALALKPGQAPLAGARVRQVGHMDLSDGQAAWTPLRSRQTVQIARPGFVWDARLRMSPLVHVRACDAYAAGKGFLRASLLGLIPLADAADTPTLAHGELLRWLAEAVWYPTALLPGGAVTWTARDEASALLTVRDGDLQAALVMHFGTDGLPTHLLAPDRGRQVGDETIPTPWVVHLGEWLELGGMRVPTRAEVAWIIDGAERPYWRGTLLDVEYIRADGGR